MEKATISIVICTYNRPKLLMSTLQSVINLDFDPSRFEIIIVDNGNNDQTKDVFASINHHERCHMSYAREDKLGLSHARNKGVSLAKGGLVVFLDDDEIVPANWLKELIKPYDNDERIACVGGKIIPVFPNDVYPSWYSTAIQGFFGGVDNGDEVHEINPKNEYLGGGNISFKKQLVVDLGMFDTNLGVRSETSYAGEETELYLKVLKEGYKVYYNPKAVTYHFIEKERISKKYLYRRAFQNGISDAIYDYLSQKFICKDLDKLILLVAKYIAILFRNFGSLIKRTLILGQGSLKSRLAILRSLGKIVGFFKMIFS